MRGTYAIVVRLRRRSDIIIGRLGRLSLDPGYYCYVGSARGPGGLEARIGRHRRLASDKRGKLHWHIDYLLVSKNASIVGVLRSKTPECDLSNEIGRSSDGSVRGFGCSDCSCKSHLHYRKNPMKL